MSWAKNLETYFTIWVHFDFGCVFALFDLCKDATRILRKYIFTIFSRHKNDEKIAFYYTTERKEMIGVGQMTFGELKKKVSQYASALKKLGIKKGDILAGYLPNCPEAIIGESNH